MGVGMRIRSVVTIAAGLILASGAAAALFTLISGDIRFFTPTFVVVAVVAVCLGLPAYLAARASRNDTPAVAAIMGLIVGAAVPAIIVLSGPRADQASVGNTATVINGSYTLAGWLENLMMVGLFGLLGIGGALVFWFIVRRREPSQGQNESPPRPRRPVRTAALMMAAAGVLLAAFLIPYVTADRSCHNPLRDGRTSIGQVASFDLGVGVDQWRNVEQEVEKFRRSSDWSIRSDVRTDPSFRWFQISLCRETGTNIFVQGMADLNEVDFGVYQPQGGSTWRQDFRVLYERINARWPTKVTFKDGQGRQTGKPEWAADQNAK